MNETWRAQFDAHVAFQNGGRLEVEGFRLDVPGPEIGDDALAALFVAELGLRMAGDVRIRNKALLREPHKGLRSGAQPGAAPPPQRRVVELSHRIQPGMTTYPGLPGPELTEFLSREASRARYAGRAEFQIAGVSMIGNTGTYLDSPFHRFAEGADVSGVALAAVADLDGVVVRLLGSASRAIDRNALAAHAVRGRAVLIHTGWDRRWGSDGYGVDGPFLTAAAAAWLVEQDAALVGIDSVNIDDAGDPARPAHTVLLAAGIPIVEHLCGLEQLPPEGFRFHAAPPLFEGMTSFPVRAYAVVGGGSPE